MNKKNEEGKLMVGNAVAYLDMNYLNALHLRGAFEASGKNYMDITVEKVLFYKKYTFENGKTLNNVKFLHIKGTDTPLKLNTTNFRTMCDILGFKMDTWPGKKVRLGLKNEYRPDLRAVGPCVRILNINPETGRAPEAW